MAKNPAEEKMEKVNPHFQRNPVTGRNVAVLQEYLQDRELHLIYSKSRVVKQHEAHEVIITDEPARPGDTVNRVAYLSFVEFTATGLILRGDEVRVNGERIGEVCGFDETHMPNHLNIVVKGDTFLCGKDRGIKLNSPVEFTGTVGQVPCPTSINVNKCCSGGEPMKEEISKEEAKEEVDRQLVLLAKRCALLYQSFAQVLLEELGEEKGREAIARVIKNYGTRCGSQVRKGVEAKGLEPTLANYFTVPDLPQGGWVSEQKKLTDEELEVDILYCPLAELWQEEGSAPLGRLYCSVDQAKFSAYHPDYQCVHKENVLDGGTKCTLYVSKKRKD